MSTTDTKCRWHFDEGNTLTPARPHTMEGCFLWTKPSSPFGESGNDDGIVTHFRGKDVLHKTENSEELEFHKGSEPVSLAQWYFNST